MRTYSFWNVYFFLNVDNNNKRHIYDKMQSFYYQSFTGFILMEWWDSFKPGMGNFFFSFFSWKWGIWNMSHQVDCTPTKKITGNFIFYLKNFLLKVPQPFPLWKNICKCICFRNREKNFFFFSLEKKFL